METSDQPRNNIYAWVILGYLCSHPDAKDTAAGISKWWLPSEGIHADRQRVTDALEYLNQLGWLTTRGKDCTLKVYSLNKDRRPVLQQFLGVHGGDAQLACIYDATRIV